MNLERTFRWEKAEDGSQESFGLGYKKFPGWQVGADPRGCGLAQPVAAARLRGARGSVAVGDEPERDRGEPACRRSGAFFRSQSLSAFMRLWRLFI